MILLAYGLRQSKKLDLKISTQPKVGFLGNGTALVIGVIKIDALARGEGREKSFQIRVRT